VIELGFNNLQYRHSQSTGALTQGESRWKGQPVNGNDHRDGKNELSRQFTIIALL
jgi:hypothetical protein